VPAVSISGYIVSRTGKYAAQMTLGFVMLAGVLAAFGAVLSADLSIGAFCALLFALSVAAAPSAPQTSFVAIQAGASRRHSAAAIAISWCVRRVAAVLTGRTARYLGGTCAILISGNIVNHGVGQALAALNLPGDVVEKLRADPGAIRRLGIDPLVAAPFVEAYIASIKLVFYVLAGIAGACAVLVFALVTDVPLKSAEDLDGESAAATPARNQSELDLKVEA